jgi:hypothetical protein
MTNQPNAKPVLTGHIYDSGRFAESESSGSIDLGHYQSTREENYQMAEDKSMGQTYYEEVEALKAGGTTNADAVREVANKYDKKENAVRGGIHAYKSRHVNGNTPAATPRPRRGRANLSVDDYLANARQAVESARDLIDQEVNEAKAALDAAQARYDEVQASVKERKADVEKKLKALA